jgi:hexosaminidase
VHDIRLGGLIGRINTVQMRLSAYINGEITELDELEQEILPFKQQSGDDDGYPVCNKYHLIATQNLL